MRIVPALLLSAALAAPAFAAEPPPPVAVAFRLASVEPLPGWQEMSVAGDDRIWFVAPEVLLDQTAFAAATAMPGEGVHWIVDVVMTPRGRELLAALTREHRGRRLGMVVDGRLVTAPVIRAPLTGGRALITGGFDADEARRIAAGVMAGR